MSVLKDLHPALSFRDVAAHRVPRYILSSCSSNLLIVPEYQSLTIMTSVLRSIKVCIGFIRIERVLQRSGSVACSWSLVARWSCPLMVPCRCPVNTHISVNGTKEAIETRGSDESACPLYKCNAVTADAALWRQTHLRENKVQTY